MRALTINEIQKFERGLNPKAAMGTGGLKLEDAFNTLIKPSIEKWEAYITKTLVGKLVSGTFLKFDKDMHAGGKAGWREVTETFRVNSITNWEPDGTINVKDVEGVSYVISINQKIHIG
jgi:hypothetical protein